MAGHFLHDSHIPAETLDMAIPLLEEKERQAFLSFVSQMLTWLPEERETARELINHPFFSFEKR
jgi:serine/threonine protein kinase